MAQNKIPQAEFDAKIAIVSDMNWARLAMAVDCEGTIMIAKSHVKTGRKTPQYVLTLVVANTDPRLICWLNDNFGGHSYVRQFATAGSVLSRQCGVINRKDVMSWRQFEERAAEIIRHIMPYMIIKREQAEIALAYREIRKSGSKGRKVTADDLTVRESLRQSMCSLNSGNWDRQEK
jgi:hypothetical protein